MDNAEKKPWDSVDPREITKDILDLGESYIYLTSMIQANPDRNDSLIGLVHVRAGVDTNEFSVRHDHGDDNLSDPIKVRLDAPKSGGLTARKSDKPIVPSLRMSQGGHTTILELTPDICARLIRMLNEVLERHSKRALK